MITPIGRGFTLIEVLIASVILLATITVVAES
jgi:prepilin-type N-terminal cleavage/methylation domain-containing protein